MIMIKMRARLLCQNALFAVLLMVALLGGNHPSLLVSDAFTLGVVVPSSSHLLSSHGNNAASVMRLLHQSAAPAPFGRHLFASSSSLKATTSLEEQDFGEDEDDNEVDSKDKKKETTNEPKASEPAPAPEPSSPTKKKVVDDSVVQKNLMFLQSLGAITSRGEQATKEQRLAAQQVISELEESQSSSRSRSRSSDDDDVSLLGRWELVFCDCGQLFRSSPFFMAGRAVCQTEQQAAQYNWFCDMHRKALAISQIGPVRQIITPTQLVSEFEVIVGAIPFLSDFTPFVYSGGMPVTITGAIVSTADWTSPSTMSKDMELYMDTVEIKGSNMPLLRQVLDKDNVKLKSRDLADTLEQAVSAYATPRPVFRTTYLDDKFRVGRDEDDNIFVYVKTSDSTDLTDYSAVDADLGVARLLEGFNDAVTRLYL